MPIFEYICAECGKPFEQLVFNSSKADEVTCPACHSENVTKKISTFASKSSGGSSGSFGSSYSSASCGSGSV
jgi:putative FmdB family regulatory protein